MKKITLPLLLLYFSQFTYAQCTEPFTIPYTVNTEGANVPALPDCMDSTYMTFASTETFKTATGPVTGFTGKLFTYDTGSQGGGGAMQPTVGSTLYTYEIQLVQGTEYILSYRYANADATKTINSFGARVTRPANSYYVDLSNHQNITGATATTFTSQTFTVPSTGAYRFEFIAQSLQGQGLFYLGNISVKEPALGGLNDRDTTDILAYPNPASDNITISGTDKPDRLEVYSQTGQLLSQETITTVNHALDISTYATGIYFLKIYRGNQVKDIRFGKK
jgi:Secretion system C-terminal sorting domain